jgi:hypothetical protein
MNLLVSAAATSSAFLASSLVDFVLSLAHIPVTTILVSVINEALSLVLLTVSLVLLFTASLARTVVVGSTASIGNGCDVSDGVLNWSSEGGEAGNVLKQLDTLK